MNLAELEDVLLLQQRGGFSPTSVSKIKAWLRRTDTTTSDVAQWNEVIGSNHAVQSVAGRRPTGATNRSLVFATNDVLVMPLNTANNGATKWGLCGWLKQPASALETIFAIYNAGGGASARKLFLQTNTSQRLVFGAYISGTDGRQLMTPVNTLPTPGTPTFVYFDYDADRGGDACIKIWVDLVDVAGLTGANLGAGGTLGALPTPTGNALFGNLQDAAGALVPYNGTLYGDWFFIGDASLTLAEQTNIRTFTQPTA